jgi:hypothetical protein
MTRLLNRLLAAVFSTIARGCSATLASAALLAIVCGAGCNGIQNLRGDGFKDSDNWGENLRAQKRSDAVYGGVSTKAQQIERNLGVE